MPAASPAPEVKTLERSFAPKAFNVELDNMSIPYDELLIIPEYNGLFVDSISINKMDTMGAYIKLKQHSGLGAEELKLVITNALDLLTSSTRDAGEYGDRVSRWLYYGLQKHNGLRIEVAKNLPQNACLYKDPGGKGAILVLNLDFASTFLGFAHAPIPEDIQGASFKSIAQGSTPKDWRTAIYYRFYEQGYGIGPHEGIRTRRHKLIHFLYGDMGWELYDLSKDPNELNNVYGSPENKGLVEDLAAQLIALRKQYKVTM